ncbi:uncharacterized protein [Ptychodera flava]|uniref:uncharacterized protein n=1 Tax=Ptychodera flava TaxID=63121 RepID=UPI003969F91A
MESAGVSSGKSGASGVCLQFKRPLLIVIVGMVFITYFFSTLMEKRVNPIFKEGMETTDRTINTTEPERTTIGGYKKDVINKEKTASSPEYDVKFPYLNYDHFGMEWIGIVQEYEWSFKHLHGEDEFPKSHKPLEVGPDSFSETSIFKSK